jgi:hypothetical protein
MVEFSNKKIINKAIVICRSPHYILMPPQYKDAVGIKVSAHFGVKRPVHEVDNVMWKCDERTMEAQDLLDILNELQIPLVTMITFAMKAKVMTIRGQLGRLDLKMFDYVEIDVGFERTPFFPAVLADEPPNFAHVCLAKPDPAFQENFPLMNKPKLWPVLVPWQNNLEHDQMFGGYEDRVSAIHELEFAAKKIKGYSKLVHIWKGVTSAHLGDLPKTVITLQNLLKLCEKITAETNDSFFAAHNFRHEISISIEKSNLWSSTVVFDQAVKMTYDVHHCVHTHGIMYYQVPLKPMMAMNNLIFWANTIDFMGTRSNSAPTVTQLLQYSCMVSMLGVATRTISTSSCFFYHGDNRQEWVDTIIRPNLHRFRNHMLTPFVFLGDEESDIEWEFWEHAWAVRTLHEPHLLTATQILVRQDELEMDLFRDKMNLRWICFVQCRPSEHCQQHCLYLPTFPWLIMGI